MYRFILGTLFVLCLTLSLGSTVASSQEKDEMMDAEMMDKKEMIDGKGKHQHSRHGTAYAASGHWRGDSQENN